MKANLPWVENETCSTFRQAAFSEFSHVGKVFVYKNASSAILNKFQIYIKKIRIQRNGFFRTNISVTFESD